MDQNTIVGDEPVLPSVEKERLRALLSEMEDLDRELTRRRREQGIKYYIPNPMQKRAHLSKANTKLYVGGNRAGKSTYGAAEVALHLTREYPDWYPVENRFTHPVKIVIVATEFPIVQRVIEPKLLAYIPRSIIQKTVKSPQGYISRMQMVDGSTVDILTNEMAQLAFESADWDFAWIDEPTQRSKYVAIRRGLVDRQGRMCITFTPIVEPWMKEELVDKADGRFIDVITVDIRDNMFDVEGNPIQSETAIQMFSDALTEDERATRLHGQFFHMRGLVYSIYTPSAHERPLVYEYPDPVICVLDPHTRKPHHLIWAFVRRDDALFVDRELLFSGPMLDLKKAILRTEIQAGYKMRKRLIDPNFGHTPNVITGRTVMEELARPPYAVMFTEANDEKEAGILKVREALSFDRTKPIDPFKNTPKLFFHPRCTATIKSIRNYQFDEWRGTVKHERDVKEEAKQKDTDGADCVRYLCMDNITHDRMTYRSSQYELEAAPY